MSKQYFVADIHGMCGGVFAALKQLQQTIDANCGRTVYVLHELVHNTTVTRNFQKQNVCFADEPSDIPPGSITIIGAHGISLAQHRLLESQSSQLIDATCPLVRKLQNIAASLTADDQLIIFGKTGHPEVIGVAGHSNAGANFIVSNAADIESLPELNQPSFISQTTVDAVKSREAMRLLKQRFPQMRCFDGVCNASIERQQAVIDLAGKCDLVLVAGSAHSSNACRLREIAENAGVKAVRIDNASELPEAELQSISRVGITSGASTPAEVTEKIISRLEELGFSS